VTLTFRQSEIQTFRDCPRQWYLQYHRGLYKPGNGTVSRADEGTLYHGAMEELYMGRDPFTHLDAQESITAAAFGVTPELGKMFKLVRTMVTGYIDWLEKTGADAGWEVQWTERQLAVSMGNIYGFDVVVTGKLDLGILDAFGLPKTVDHKTVSTFDQASGLYLNSQGRTYGLLMRMLGEPQQGFIHNQARRVLRSAAAKPPFYNRVEVRYNDKLLDAHEKHLRSVLNRMVEATEMLNTIDVLGPEAAANWGPSSHHSIVPPNPGKDCSWRCPFEAVCGMLDDGSDAEGYINEVYDRYTDTPTEEEARTP
jgi:hypothetical protein